MSNLEKMTEMLKNDPTLQEKLSTEARQMLKNGTTNPGEILAGSIKTVMGLDLSEEEKNLVLQHIQQLSDKTAGDGKLDLEELEGVAGGNTKDAIFFGILGAGLGVFIGSVGGPIGAGIGAVAGGTGGAIAGGKGYMEEIFAPKKKGSEK